MLLLPLFPAVVEGCLFSLVLSFAKLSVGWWLSLGELVDRRSSTFSPLADIDKEEAEQEPVDRSWVEL